MAFTTDARADSLIELHICFRWCRIWIITRVDGTVYRLTDHDKILSWEGNNYLPSGGFTGSAREFRAAQAENNFSANGILNSSLINASDLHGGLFEEAKVEEYIIDWKYPFAGHIRKDVWWISRMNWDNNSWTAELEGPKRFLRKRAGETLSFLCTNSLGQGVCGLGVDLESSAFKKTGTVILIITQRRIINMIGLIIPAATTFNNGRVTWTSGNNVGIISEIKTYDRVTQILELETPTPFDITDFDTATVRAGCSKTEGKCKSIFDNFENYRGRPHIEGTDSILPISV